MKRFIAGAVLALSLMSIGCIGSAVTPPPDLPPGTPPLPPAEQSKLDTALTSMAAHDRANDWSAAVCADVSSGFLAVEGDRAAPLYNAGLARARCGDRAGARALIEKAARRDPSFIGARVALARYAAAGPELDRAIADMQSVVVGSRFANVDAMVALGELLMRRNRGPADLADAKASFHRALAIDDGNMPAQNQLALYYLRTAKRGKGGKPDTASIDLAMLICSQAIRKNGAYAPIHNTAGLLYTETGDFSRASEAFDRARALDRTLFEAHMNYAAVNLSFRGFSQAEQAYRAALALRPHDYDARLGLALALRGQIDDRNEAGQVAAARREIAAAKAAAPERPEAYFNEAILVQEFGARGDDATKRRAALNEARSLLKTFIAKADALPDPAGARRRANERIGEIDQIMGFLD